MQVRNVPERFLVAFSFAGEQRTLVSAIAHAVEEILGWETVFYDEWFQHYIPGRAPISGCAASTSTRQSWSCAACRNAMEDKPWTHWSTRRFAPSRCASTRARTPESCCAFSPCESAG